MSTRLADLDTVLFEPATWRALNAANQQVKGVRAPDLDAALALIGRGSVATIYGTLNDAVRVVDIDVTGIDGYSVVDQLEAWAGEHSVWHLTRPSGGADGRHHVYVLVRDAHGDHLPALTGEVERLRAWLEAPTSAIDVRRYVRPLSAPHRTGETVAPYGDVAAALRDLRARLTTTTTLVDPAPTAPEEGAAHEDRRTPLLPRPRPRRALPPEWAAYLATGETPALGGADHSRTTAEVVCLSHMIRAGWTWREALHAIWAAHEHAMTRARTGGLHRLIGIWNRAVVADHAWTAEHGITSTHAVPVPDEIAAAVAEARQRLDDLAWTYSPRQRPALLLVGDALLARVTRTRALRVPCPQRDLVEDTGLDRSTIGAVLQRLADAGLGTLHTDTLNHSPAHRATSSFEFEIAPARGVREIPPPCSHTPIPPPGTWSLLPPRAHQLHRALPNAGSPGLPLPDLATAALATPTPEAPLSESQARTLTHDLQALARAGLAVCDEHGHWTRRDTPTPEHAIRAAAAHTRAAAQHQGERAAYRAGAHTSWAAQRREVLARNHEREQAWWQSLTPGERARRRDAARARYRALPVTEQARVKHDLAARRHRAGIDEAERHAAWIAAWHPDALAQRQAEHAAAYRAQPAPLQAALVAMWTTHRDTWGIPHPAQAQAASA